jgi:hypothetical protein
METDLAEAVDEAQGFAEWARAELEFDRLHVVMAAVIIMLFLLLWRRRNGNS